MKFVVLTVLTRAQSVAGTGTRVCDLESWSRQVLKVLCLAVVVVVAVATCLVEGDMVLRPKRLLGWSWVLAEAAIVVSASALILTVLQLAHPLIVMVEPAAGFSRVPRPAPPPDVSGLEAALPVMVVMVVAAVVAFPCWGLEPSV